MFHLVQHDLFIHLWPILVNLFISSLIHSFAFNNMISSIPPSVNLFLKVLNFLPFIEKWDESNCISWGRQQDADKQDKSGIWQSHTSSSFLHTHCPTFLGVKSLVWKFCEQKTVIWKELWTPKQKSGGLPYLWVCW